MTSDSTIWGAASFTIIAGAGVLKWLLKEHMDQKKQYDTQREQRLDERFKRVESALDSARTDAGRLREDMHALDKRLIVVASEQGVFKDTFEAFQSTVSEAIGTTQKLLGFLGQEPNTEKIVQISPTHWLVMKPRKPSKPK